MATLPKLAQVLDIETRRHPELKARLGLDEKLARLEDMEVDQLQELAESEEIKLGNRKSQEAVLAKVQSHYQGIADKAALRLYGATVSAIGISTLDPNEPITVGVVEEGTDEAALIQMWIDKCYHDRPAVIGFHIRGFDLPMLRARCALLGLNWPEFLPATQQEDRRVSPYVCDLRDVLIEGSLDTWLRMAGLPPKTGDGLSAGSMTPAELRQYCGDDVERTKRLANRILPTIPMFADLAHVV